MIQINKSNELNVFTTDKLNSWVDIEFGQIPIVEETERAQPDWTIIYIENGEIKTFYNIIEREIFVDDIKFKIGGVNNVITPK